MSDRVLKIKLTDEQKQDQEKVDLQIVSLMKEVYKANKEKNKYTNAEKNARNKLYKVMSLAGRADHKASIQIDEDTKLDLEAEISRSIKIEIDVEKLKNEVSEETFMKIVTAAKGKVETFAGSDVAVKCGSKKAGDENVSVKVAK